MQGAVLRQDAAAARCPRPVSPNTAAQRGGGGRKIRHLKAISKPQRAGNTHTTQPIDSLSLKGITGIKIAALRWFSPKSSICVLFIEVKLNINVYLLCRRTINYSFIHVEERMAAIRFLQKQQH